MLHDIKSYTQIYKSNQVDLVGIWPEPDLKNLPDRPEPDFRSHTALDKGQR